MKVKNLITLLIVTAVSGPICFFTGLNPPWKKSYSGASVELSVYVPVLSVVLTFIIAGYLFKQPKSSISIVVKYVVFTVLLANVIFCAALYWLFARMPS